MQNKQKITLRAALLVFITIITELVSISLVFICLTRTHSPWLWGVVALGFFVFWCLLNLHRRRDSALYGTYSFLCLVTVVIWGFFDKNLVLTLIDWVGLSIALIGALLLMLWPSRSKEQERSGD
ncbi:hypothetical protein LPB67_16035 [Undibacterium sp. Jales W-56]|uniref:hypothetical protein n=1 Tax=Undibacterium sp. Jales W-56 TaxID=2897325 RepID=UPI0021D0B5D3|nr:hypothetical protein [Undibacterium sp. Jales W-56]MCU6435286.1 hypothetical protein [Undibacterium sp. Jales W-56]